jgi:hypothetical protein
LPVGAAMIAYLTWSLVRELFRASRVVFRSQPRLEQAGGG